MADGSIKFDLEILDEKAKKRLSELEAIIENTGDTVDDELSNKAFDFINKWEQAEKQYSKIMQNMEKKTKEINQAVMYEMSMEDAFGIDSEQTKRAYEATRILREEHELLNLKLEEQIIKQDRIGINAERLTEKVAEQSNEHLGLNRMVEEHNRLVDEQLNKEDVVFQKQSRIGNLLETTKNTISRIVDGTKDWVKETNNTESGVKKVSKSSKGMSSSFAGSAKSLFKVSLAMLGIRGAMTGLTKLTNQWYQSNNAGARQAQANMQVMTNGIVNLLAPALTFVTNIMAQLMGYINAIAKAFFGVNLLSKSTSKNIGTGTKNAKKLSKEVKGITTGFDEADVASADFADGLDGVGGAGGGGAVDLEPNIVTPDLSDFKKKMEEAFKPLIDTIKSIDLKPLELAFQQLGNSIVNILGIIGNSFANIMNYSIAPFIKLMAEEIVPRFLILFAEALDMLAPHLEWFLTELVEPFVNWLLLDFSPVGFETLARAFELLTVVVDIFLKAMKNVWEDVEPIAIWMGGVFKDMVEGLGEAFAELTEELKEDDSGMLELFETMIKLVGILLIIKGATSAFTGVVGILTGAIGILTKIFAPLWSIIKLVAGFFAGAFSGSVLAIIALVAILSTMLVGLATNFEQVKEDFFRIVGNIKGIFSGLLEFLGGVFTGDWKRIWKGLIQIFSNIIGGIANIFKFPINLMIDGLNAFIRGLNKIKIPSWVPAVGGKGINIGQIPRLAQGATLTHQTVAMMAEYPNARTNPEIVTPEDKMREVFNEALLNQGGTNNSGTITIEMPVYLGTKKIYEEIKELQLQDLLQNGGGNLGWNTL